MSHTFAIEGEFSIYRATELAQTLNAWLPQAEQHGAAVLNLSEVTEMDSAGLQLLLSLQLSAHSLGLPLQLEAASPAVMEVLKLAALEHLIQTADELQAPSVPAL